MTVDVLALTSTNPEEPEALVGYLATTQPLLEKAGAEIIERRPIEDTIVGTPGATFVTRVRYPDRMAVESVFRSAEYRTLQEIRDRAFLVYQIHILGE